jgi:acetyl esterase
MSVLEARAMVAASVSLQGPAPAVHRVHDVLAAGAAGALPVRVVAPTPQAAAPLMVYFHGGGFVVGSVEVADAPCRALALGTGCVVASVGYRRAPETPFPGPAEDAYAATCWLAEHAAELGAGGERLVVCGDSAGGNLAAVVALMARDRGGPRIDHQVLLYPTLMPPARADFASHRENATGYGLRRSEILWFWDHYLAAEEDGLQPYASPLLAPDLAGLPPASILSAEYDLLRDESLAYAERLREAGVPADVHVYPGMIHGFFWMDKALDEARAVPGAIAEALRRPVG